MHVKRLTMENVKGFKGRHSVEFSPGMNFLVGDNNTGKTTAIEALLFLFQGPTATRWTPETFYSRGAAGPTLVEAEIAGDLEGVLNQEKFSKLSGYVSSGEGGKTLRLQRSSEERTVTQNGRKKNFDCKTGTIWNPNEQQFENPTGIDAVLKSLFDFEPVWANAQPADHLDFSSNKTLGRILSSALDQFSTSERWKRLTEAHQAVFLEEDSKSFRSATDDLAEELKKIVDEQYGSADYRFDFSLPDASVFMKQGCLLVNDGMFETPVEGKGTGMQRAIALALIQLYAKTASTTPNGTTAPLVLILDEPETWLHPKAQLNLIEALDRISTQEQILVVTHSPYLIRNFRPSRHQLVVTKSCAHTPRFVRSKSLGLLRSGDPSWSEINYHAFDICDTEFHNELYAEVTRLAQQYHELDGHCSISRIDEFLASTGMQIDRVWRNANGNDEYRTVASCIRNSIHHPENSRNEPYSESEFRASIEHMMAVLQEAGGAEGRTAKVLG